jgi:hypothetical protein
LLQNRYAIYTRLPGYIVIGGNNRLQTRFSSLEPTTTTLTVRQGSASSCPKQNDQYSERKKTFSILKSDADHYLPEIHRAGSLFCIIWCRTAFNVRASHATKASLLGVVLFSNLELIHQLVYLKIHEVF